MNEDEAREKIEEMQRRNSGIKLIGGKKMANEMTFTELKQKYEKLKQIIVNALISLDWLLKVGIPVTLWFWAVPQDNWMQSIGLASYVILLTIISKTITKVKTQE